jgi:sodium-coupled monocarboxylate transporter 8/12
VLIVTILFILLKIPLTMAEVSNYLQSNTGLLTLNWSLDPTVAMTVWAMAIGGTMQNMSSFTADQMSLQRYLASGSVKAASSAFGTSMLTTSIVLLLLSGVGLTLGAWYSLHPDPAMPADADKVFPHFVATQLPVGFMGMVIAAILAATMSSITSGINALSGSLLNDFSALSERIEAKRLLNWARWTSVGIGVLATLVAGFVDGMGSLFDIMNAFYGIFLGPLLACMFCTVSRLRLNGWGLITGMVAGCIFGIWVAYSSLANLWVSLYSAIMTVIIAWVATLILGKSPAKQR